MDIPSTPYATTRYPRQRNIILLLRLNKLAVTIAIDGWLLRVLLFMLIGG
jgi:hypothetical protein